VARLDDAPVSTGPPSRREATRLARERGRRRNEDRVAWLRSQLEPGELTAATDSHVIVTDRRIVFALRLYGTRYIPDETREAIGFDGITGWTLGRLHDERPLIRLQHAPRVRVEWKAAHNVLWFHWGNASRRVTHRESTLPFRSRRDTTLRAIMARLEADAVSRGSDWVIELEGTREKRAGSVVLYREE
jgi:hypothetical protein